MEKIKVLAFTGSPRKGGNTETLVAAVMSGVTRAGGVAETVRLPALSIGPCIGCGGCQKTGRCVIEDDMQGLYDKILAARIIIIASPIYFYGLSAQTKLFVDRIQALWSRKQLLVAAHQWRLDPQRKGYLVSVAATGGEKVFVGAQLTAQYAFDAMGVGYGGDFLVRGVDQRGEMKKETEQLTAAEAFGYTLGRE
jgi:multimeric flavodoxin WrbA